MSTSAKNFILFVGSIRDGRMCSRVTKYVKDTMEAQGFNVTLYDPREMNFEMMRQPYHYMPNPSEAPEYVKEMDLAIKASDGFVIVTPEYNSTLPPALSNMLGTFSPESYWHRPAAFITYSITNTAGARVGAFLRSYVADLGMISLPTYTGNFAIPHVSKNFSEDGKCLNERISNKIERILSEFQWYCSAMKNHRENFPQPSTFAQYYELNL